MQINGLLCWFGGNVVARAALAVLKQDWQLPKSTKFDTISEESDPLRNEMTPVDTPSRCL